MMDIESAQAGGVVESQHGDRGLLESANWVVKCTETLFCSLGEETILHGGEEKISVHGTNGGGWNRRGLAGAAV